MPKLLYRHKLNYLTKFQKAQRGKGKKIQTQIQFSISQVLLLPIKDHFVLGQTMVSLKFCMVQSHGS